MASGTSSYGTGADEAARLAALKRAAEVQNAGGGSLPFDTTSGALTSGAPTPTSGANPTGAAQVAAGGGALPYDMDALRRAASEAAAKANAANATNPAYAKPGDAAAGGGSLPFSVNGSGAVTGSGASSFGATDPAAIQRALTGGSLATVQPPVAQPTGAGQTNLTTAGATGAVTATGGSKAAQIGVTSPNAATSPLAAAGTTETPAPAGAGTSSINQGGDLGALTSQISQQLQSIGQSVIGPNATPDVTGVFLQQSQAILKMLDEQEAQLRAENEKAGTTIDPSTQFTIDKMREGLNEQLKTVREDLNRRGLNDSGILLELENRLQKGSMSDQSRVLAERLTSLQDQLTKGLAGIRGQKYSTMQSFGSDAANAQFTAGENQKKNALDREQSQLQGMLNLRGQMSGENENSLQRSFQGNENALQRAYGNAQFNAKTAAEFEANKLDYERQLALQSAKTPASTGGTAISRAAAARPAAGGSEPNSQTWSAINDLMNTFGSSAEATRAIQEQEGELVAAGVDLSRLYDAASKIAGTDRRRS